ncbi:hypothetical protein Tco_0755498, partial [Tanacetum coccineum]
TCQERRQPTGVQIKYTPGVSVSKKKTPARAERNKGDGVGFQPKVPDKPKGKSINIHEGTGLKPGVPDVSKANSSYSEYEYWGVSDDDDDDQQGDDERTESDDDKSVDLNKIDDEEETQEDEFVHTPDDYVPTNDETHDVDDEEYHCINEEIYDDVNVELKDVEPVNEGKGDKEMTDAEKVIAELEEVNQEVAIPHENSTIQTSILLAILVLVIPEPLVIKPIPEIVTAAPAANIPPFISHSQQSTPIPTPTTAEATTSTTATPESATLSAIHQRVYDLEKEVKIPQKR